MRDCAQWCGFVRVASSRASSRFVWQCDPGATLAGLESGDRPPPACIAHCAQTRRRLELALGPFVFRDGLDSLNAHVDVTTLEREELI
jgi:hypothetical protein